MDLHDVVASKDLESLVPVPAHGVTRSNRSSGVLFCYFTCPCVQAAVRTVAFFIHQMLGLPVVRQYPFPLRLIPAAVPHGKSNCCLVVRTTQRGTVRPRFLYLILFAGVNVGHGLAPPAAHVAAPDKLAFAPLHVPDNVGVVPAPAAEEVAAIGAL